MAKVMVIVEGKTMVDYGYPSMQAKKLLNEAYNAANEGELDKAIELTLEAMSETKLMLNALKDFKASKESK
jgi:hypothetical protein